MWKAFDKFHKSSESQQEAVESVIQGRANMYAISARDIAFQVREE